MDPQQHDMISSRRSQTKHEPQVNSSCFATAAAKEAESAFEDRIRFENASIDFAPRAKQRERERESECVLCTAIALSRTAGAILSPGFRLSLTSANYLRLLLHFTPHSEDEKERFPLVFFILSVAKRNLIVVVNVNDVT
jgi:hypothetical protein